MGGLYIAIFANCKKILAKGVIIFEDMERSCAAVCREQNIEDQMIYSLLGYMLSTFRDFLDASGNGNGISIAQKQYAAFCRQIIFILKEELGPSYATEQHIPALRLLAGIINGTVS